jgi:hypothetical protein
MRARSSAASLLAALALSLSSGPDAPSYTVESTGAIRLVLSGREASYGLLPESVNGRLVISISLGPTRGEGALWLFAYADEVLRPGRFQVTSWLPEQPFAGRYFHPCFVAGTVASPRGFFHGEAGWVTITSVEGGRISGEFEMRARGFLAEDTSDEDRWVTLRGRFSATGDSTVAANESRS